MYKKIITLAMAGLLAFSVPAAAAPSTWAAQEVKLAQDAGIVPERIQSAYQDAVTREEFCEMAMLFWCKLTGKEMPQATATFLDTQNAAVSAAQSLGIVKGESETQFSPQNPVTRQEMCVMLKNALQAAMPEIRFPEEYPNTYPDAEAVAEWATDAVKCMNLFAVMLGDENGNINPLGNTTREQSILLAYRLLLTQTMTMQEYVEKFLMPVNGNTHDNMLNGAFTVGTADGKLYYSGENGIRVVGQEAPVVEKAAKNMEVIGSTLYYIGADGAVYMVDLKSGTESVMVADTVDAFSAINGAIYFRSTKDGKAYKMPVDTREIIAISQGTAELPAVTGDGTFYTDGEAIYKVNADAQEVVFQGKCKNLCVKSEKFYFINGNGLISKADLSGANFAVISALPVRSFAFTRDCLIALTEDGSVYKVDYSGRYAIKMDTGTYVNINTYDDYVYAQDAEGGIWKFSNLGTEKARIN